MQRRCNANATQMRHRASPRRRGKAAGGRLLDVVDDALGLHAHPDGQPYREEEEDPCPVEQVGRVEMLQQEQPEGDRPDAVDGDHPAMQHHRPGTGLRLPPSLTRRLDGTGAFLARRRPAGRGAVRSCGRSTERGPGRPALHRSAAMQPASPRALLSLRPIRSGAPAYSHFRAHAPRSAAFALESNRFPASTFAPGASAAMFAPESPMALPPLVAKGTTVFPAKS